MRFTGTDGGDYIEGTDGDDILEGLGGDDDITGFGGNDRIDGGAGNDNLFGDDGNDTVIGGDGHDYIDGGFGDDLLYGGAGDDSIQANWGSDIVRAGLGNDSINFDRSYYGAEASSSVLYGGDGGDSFRIFLGYNQVDTVVTAYGEAGIDWFSLSGGFGQATAHGGDGGDRFDIYLSGASFTISLGAETDYIVLRQVDWGHVAMVVTDFDTGANGDVLVWDEIPHQMTGIPYGSNPFSTGHARLLQNGTDTLLQIDRDGAGTGYDFETLIRFENTQASTFNEANVGFDTSGEPPVGETINGTENADYLVGTAGGDTIYGRGGNDDIYGLLGDDIVYGGAGIDSITSTAGNDRSYGDDGDDYLFAYRDEGMGTSQDRILLDGGNGNDLLFFNIRDTQFAGTLTAIGGAGDDLIGASGEAGNVVVRAGAGNDEVYVETYGMQWDIRLGDGQDIVRIFGGYSYYDYNQTLGEASSITIGDFQPGESGDEIALGDTLIETLTGWYDDGGNPFAGGYLQMIQHGSDVLLQYRHTSGYYVTMVTFQNTVLTDFVYSNLGFNYDGTPGPGITWYGSQYDDYYEGTEGGDTLYGLGQNDTIYGLAGDDSIYGGDGNDWLDGNGGSNDLFGGSGNDTLYSSGLNDRLYGGEGDDQLSLGRYDTDPVGRGLMQGGNGNDGFGGEIHNATRVDAIGGAGRDDFHINGSDGSVVIRAGLDDDTVWLTFNGLAMDVALGSGRDTLRFDPYALTPSGDLDIVIRDFDTAAGGDLMQIDELFYLGIYAGQNPFRTQHMRFWQDGSDALLQVRDYSGEWTTVATFENHDISDFANGWSVTYNPGTQSLTGSSSDDLLRGSWGSNTLRGGAGNDTLRGLAGDDFLYGENGADRLYGGEGDDYMRGGYGGDTLEGGAGEDEIFGDGGDDAIDGGDGDDALFGGNGADTISGGRNHDVIDGGADDDRLYGGVGMDTLTGGQGNDLLNGGSGNDLLYGRAGNDRLFGGTGDDWLEGNGGADTLNGEAGADTLIGGDGNDTLNGGGGNDSLSGDAGRDLLVGGFGADLLSGGDDADVLRGGGQDDVLVGDGGDDQLFGDDGADQLDGGAGADLLSGGTGSDLLYGGIGNDRLIGGLGDDSMDGGAGDDILDGGAGNDILLGEGGNDRLTGGAGFDLLFGGFGGDTLVGGADHDELYGEAGADRLFGDDGDDILFGGDGDDRLEGGAGLDLLFGGDGDDVLTGGGGTDVFLFNTGLGAGNVDTITDFAVGTDGIILDLGVFSGIGSEGVLEVAAFRAGTNATTASQRIIYDSATGNIWYDADGSGSQAKVLFAKVDAGTQLTASSFEAYDLQQFFATNSYADKPSLHSTEDALMGSDMGMFF